MSTPRLRSWIPTERRRDCSDGFRWVCSKSLDSVTLVMGHSLFGRLKTTYSRADLSLLADALIRDSNGSTEGRIVENRHGVRRLKYEIPLSLGPVVIGSDVDVGLVLS